MKRTVGIVPGALVRTFIEMTNNEEALTHELQKRKGRSSP